MGKYCVICQSSYPKGTTRIEHYQMLHPAALEEEIRERQERRERERSQQQFREYVLRRPDEISMGALLQDKIRCLLRWYML
jgi:hypothetical protein